jgi:hypothetical protein
MMEWEPHSICQKGASLACSCLDCCAATYQSHCQAACSGHHPALHHTTAAGTCLCLTTRQAVTTPDHLLLWITLGSGG